MKSKDPLGRSLAIVGYTFGGYIALFVAGNLAVPLIFGADAEMNWPFSFLLLLFAPLVFLGGIIGAAVVYTRERCRPVGESK